MSIDSSRRVRLSIEGQIPESLGQRGRKTTSRDWPNAEPFAGNKWPRLDGAPALSDPRCRRSRPRGAYLGQGLRPRSGFSVRTWRNCVLKSGKVLSVARSRCYASGALFDLLVICVNCFGFFFLGLSIFFVWFVLHNVCFENCFFLLCKHFFKSSYTTYIILSSL